MDSYALLERAIERLRTSSCPTWLDQIADYAAGDNAANEMYRSIKRALRRLGITNVETGRPIYTGNFQTLRAGFEAGLSALAPPERRWDGPTFTYMNVAPRKNQPKGESRGEKLYLALTHDGAMVFGPNAGFCYSFLRPELAAVFEIGEDKGAWQFRSADDFPNRLEDAFKGSEMIGVKALRPDDWSIPELPGSAVSCIDNYGNCKLSLDVKNVELEDGQPVLLHLPGDRQVRARFALANNFSAGQGGTSFGAGSSRFTGQTGVRRWMELFIVGEQAATKLQLNHGDEIRYEAA